ncbi:MAG TPA: hypothetical protein VHT91_21505 [Kofleriaceae bacterium]|jgi:hypothetical protein|nr:hypothetical protein [Kofleriaceae bacterium]
MYGSANPAEVAEVNDGTRIVVYQSTDREGSTFALSPEARRMLQKQFGPKFHGSPRIFIAHDIRAHDVQGDLERLHGRLAKQLVMLLTGLDDQSLAQIGDIEFRDPVTDQRL